MPAGKEKEGFKKKNRANYMLLIVFLLFFAIIS